MNQFNSDVKIKKYKLHIDITKITMLLKKKYT